MVTTSCQRMSNSMEVHTLAKAGGPDNILNGRELMVKLRSDPFPGPEPPAPVGSCGVSRGCAMNACLRCDVRVIGASRCLQKTQMVPRSSAIPEVEEA